MSDTWECGDAYDRILRVGDVVVLSRFDSLIKVRIIDVPQAMLHPARVVEVDAYEKIVGESFTTYILSESVLISSDEHTRDLLQRFRYFFSCAGMLKDEFKVPFFSRQGDPC